MNNLETLDLLWCKLIVATMDATTPEFSITLNKEECMEAIKGMEELKEALNDLNSLVKCIAESPKEETPKTKTMTLEQAIEHLEEELKNKQDWSCVACKEDHKQLLCWLKELQKARRYHIKWYEQLSIDGCNSKQMVRNDIQFLQKESQENE